MKSVPAAVVVLLLGAACQLSADTIAIGQIQLNGPTGSGLQTVSVLNLTGVTDGCEQQASQYSVCNSVNIDNWTLQINYTNEITNMPAQQVTFTSSGSQDDIGPTDLVNNLSGYSGDPVDSWSLPYNVQNSSCTPSCDDEITSIVLSGTVDQPILQTGAVPGGPYTPFNLASQNFSIAWNVFADDDYPAGQTFLSDSMDITLSQQSPQSGVPEPSSIALILAGGAAFCLLSRARLLSTRR